MNISMHFSRRKALVSGVIGATVLVGLLGITPAANASTVSPADTSADAQSCAFLSTTGETVCVAAGEDLHAAVLDETGYTVIQSSTAPTGAQQRAALGTAAVYVQAKLFADANKGGASYEIDGSSGCTNSTVYQVASIDASWYTKVTSFAGYAGCRVKVWELNNYKGASYGYYASTNNVGNAMNDRTHSVQMTK